MTNNDIIEIYYSDIKNLCHKLIGINNYTDDFIQEIFIILLCIENGRLNLLHQTKNIIRFTYSIIQRQFYSKSSPFYKKYKKYGQNRRSIFNNE